MVLCETMFYEIWPLLLFMSCLIPIIIGIAVLVLLVAIFLHRPEGFPPGPRGLPIVGYYPFINKDHNYIVMEQIGRKYGPVSGIYLGPYRAILVQGWEAVKVAYQNEDINGRPDLCLPRDRFGGKKLGLAFTDGEFWKVQRRFALQHFRNLGFAKRSHADIIQAEIKVLLQELTEKKLQPLRMEDPIMLTEINVIWALLGGKRFGRKDQKLHRMMHFVQQLMSPVRVTGNVAIAIPFLRYIFPGITGYKQICSAARELLAIIRRWLFPEELKHAKVISLKRATQLSLQTTVKFIYCKSWGSVEEHKALMDLQDPNDFIGIFLKEMKSEEDVHSSFTEEQLEALCIDIICGTSDTSASAILFGIMFLCLNTEIQEKLFAEIDGVVGRDRLPCLDDRSRLPIVEAFILETLRMRTPAPIPIPHFSSKDTYIMGYRIPANSMIFLNVRSVMMDPEYWGDPEVFRPERFLTETGKLGNEERIVTFGKGKRSCLGEGLAKMTSFLLISSLVQRFVLRFPAGDPAPDTKGVLRFTLNAPEFRVVLTPRF